MATTYLFFALRVTDFILSTFTYIYNLCDSFLINVENWVKGIHNNWIFLRDTYTPINMACFNESQHSTFVPYYYYNTTGYFLHKYSVTSPVNYTLPWLSANIVCDNVVYPLDDFLRRFSFDADGAVIDPKLLLSCWSLHSHRWFLPSDNVKFEIIDEDANCFSIPAFTNDDSLLEIWDAFFPFNEEEEEKDVPEQEGLEAVEETQAVNEAENKNQECLEAVEETENKEQEGLVKDILEESSAAVVGVA
jgi:hypothetical protein